MPLKPPMDSLFSADTLEGLRGAAADAAHAPEPGANEICDQVAAGVAACDAGQIDQGRRLFARALASTNDPRLLYLGFQFHFRCGEYDEAEKFVLRRLAAAPEDSPDRARAFNNLGLIFHFRGDHSTAERHLRQALEIDTRINHRQGMARDLGNLSLIPEARGDLDEARRLNLESLTIAESISFTPVIASRLCNLGEIALAMGQPAQARPLFVRAAELFRELGIHKHVALCERHLATIDSRP